MYYNIERHNIIVMELEEILKKYIEVKELLESNELLVLSGLVESSEKQDVKDAEALLARATKADAELLALTTKSDADILARATKADAELLARTTESAADQLRISNEVSVKWMTWLTIAMLLVGFIQIIIAIVPLFK